MAKIVITGKLPKNPVIVEGFPSRGFVSTITTSHMIRELGMKLIGYIESEDVSGIVVIKDSNPYRPIRIYAKDNIILIYSEVIIPFTSIPKLSGEINRWIEKIKPSMVVLMAGITGIETERSHQILGVVSDKSLTKTMENLGVKVIKDGVLTGISSNILINCAEKNIKAIGLMAETEYTPDAMAAATMLDIINKLLKTNISSEALKNMGKQVEEEFRRLMKQIKKGREGYDKMEETCPMYQ